MSVFAQFQLLSGASLFQMNRDDDLLSPEDFLKMAYWNGSSLELKMAAFRSSLSHQEESDHDLRSACDLLSWLFQPDPANRPHRYEDVLARAFFDERGSWRMSALHTACVNGDAIDITQHASDLHSQVHPMGSTPLYVCVAEHRTELVMKLVREFKSIGLFTVNNLTPCSDTGGEWCRSWSTRPCESPTD